MSRPYARPLDIKHGRIDLTHGAGGLASHQLVEQLFLPAWRSTWAAQLPHDWADAQDDAATLPPPPHLPAAHRWVMATDAHVVSPLFFPGGDIGQLAIYGTVNDLCMKGATPCYLTVSFILEEGLPLADLQRVVQSMQAAAQQAQVAVVAGDTKVVERGKADGLYISTAGLGWAPAQLAWRASAAQAGDAILISGTVGDHGVAILSQRQGLQFDSPITSDCAGLQDLVQSLRDSGLPIHTLRDPTRGGVATALNEIAQAAGVGMRLRERDIPVRNEVRAACELLGLDPLYLANEGKCLVICPADVAEAVLGLMRAHPLGQQACRIGDIVTCEHADVQLQTPFGGWRMLDWLMGDPLPRIC